MHPVLSGASVKAEMEDEEQNLIDTDDEDSCATCDEEENCKCSQCLYRNSNAYDEENDLFYLDPNEVEILEHEESGDQNDTTPKIKDTLKEAQIEIHQNVAHHENNNNCIDNAHPLEIINEENCQNGAAQQQHQQTDDSETAVPFANQVNEEHLQRVECNQNNGLTAILFAQHRIESQKYECLICLKTFNRKVSHDAHLLKHSLNDALTSEEDSFELQPESDLESVAGEHHLCSVCKQTFISKSQLNQHLKQHTKCPYCQKLFLSATSGYINHLRVHTGEKPFKCSQCNQKFTQKSNLTKHFKNVHCIKPFKCLNCENAFSFKEFQIHKINCTNGLTQTSQSTSVNSNFTTHEASGLYNDNTKKTSHLQNHATVPSTSTVIYKKALLKRKKRLAKTRFFNNFNRKTRNLHSCHLCQSRFKTKGNLKNHLKVHTRKDQSINTSNENLPIEPVETNENFHICAQCSQSFDSKQNLENHISHFHNFDKTFRCQICSQSFEQNEEFQIHFQEHQNSNLVNNSIVVKTESTFSCLQCNKQYVNEYALIVHLRTHRTIPQNDICHQNTNLTLSGTISNNGKLPVLTSNNKCQWENCKKIFKNSDGLQRHIRTHTGEKPFKCTICLKTFSERGNRNKHQAKHNCCAIYKCKICKLKFKSFENLKKHLKTHSDVLSN